MKKTVIVLLALAMIFSLAGCGTGQAKTYELALVTDLGSIDDRSFNQGAWEGLVQYAEANNISHKYYEPTEQSMSAYADAIKLAVDGGAKVIVCPGYLFENAVHQTQTLYPEVKFIILDGSPHNVTNFETMATYDGSEPNYTVAENTYSIFFKEEQAGFLAGYAAVKDGFKKLGFMGGMAVPAVVRFGYGFVQGAEYAAKELGIKDISVIYHYTGGFSATPEAQAKAASWYASGVEVIFACGGAVGDSVMSAAESAGTFVIGVDVDQSNLSATVITSSMKNLKVSVFDAITAFYNDTFPGGTSVKLGADVQGVGLPMETSKFREFKQADYDAIFQSLAQNTNNIASSIKTEADATAVTKIKLTNVKVTEDK